MKLSACFLLAAATTALCSAQSAPLNLKPPVNNTPPVRVFPAPRGTDLEHYSNPSIWPGRSAEENQMGCPLVLTNVSIQGTARLMPVGSLSSNAGSPSLNLEFRNMSGKKILAATIKAQLKFKRSVYNLDSTTFDLYLTLPGTAITNEKGEQVRIFPLHVPAFGVAAVTLQHVTYIDGSVWTAGAANSCATGPVGTERIAAK